MWTWPNRLRAWLAWQLSDESGQIPSSLTDNYDALLTTTLRAMQPRLHDNISRGSKLVAWLEARGSVTLQQK